MPKETPVSMFLFIFSFIATSHAADDSVQRSDPMALAARVINEGKYLQVMGVDVMDCDETRIIAEYLLEVRGVESSDDIKRLSEVDSWNLHLLKQREQRVCDGSSSTTMVSVPLPILDNPEPVCPTVEPTFIEVEVVREVQSRCPEHSCPEPTEWVECEPCLEFVPCLSCEAQNGDIARLTLEVSAQKGVIERLAQSNIALTQQVEGFETIRSTLQTELKQAQAQLSELQQELVVANARVSELEARPVQCPDATCPECEVCSEPTVCPEPEPVAQCPQVEPETVTVEVVKEVEVIKEVPAQCPDVTSPECEVCSEAVVVEVQSKPESQFQIIEIPDESPTVTDTTVPTLMASIKAGQVADENLITSLTCDEIASLYWAIFDRSQAVHDLLPSKLPKSADQLNELRLARHARQQGCTLNPAL